MELHLSDVLAGLSHALDLTEGHPPGHAERSCLLGMRIADAIGLAEGDRASLAGCRAATHPRPASPAPGSGLAAAW